jgi:hypothetical protein
MSDQVTHEQLQTFGAEMRESLRSSMSDVRLDLRAGFANVDVRLERLDVHLTELNGRTRKNELMGVRHEEQLKTVFNLLGRRREKRPAEQEEGAPEGRPRLISERDVRIVWMTLAAAGAVVTFGWKVVPAILEVFRAGGVR